jgi:hypothetical protein
VTEGGGYSSSQNAWRIDDHGSNEEEQWKKKKAA